jgi:hypothetical protein
VRIRYTAPTAEVDGLLDRVAAAGGPGVAQGPQQVQRIVTSGRFHVRSIEFVLTDSPLVLRETEGRAAQTTGIAGAEPSDDPASAMRTLSVAEARPASAPAQASRTPPVGAADPFAIQRRIAPLFPADCRIVDVRYAGDLVLLSGQSGQHRCVSEGLRALDGAGSRPELRSIEGDARGGYAFQISIKASSLTRR